MTREDIVVGLDIGTTKVCTIVGHGDLRSKINIAGVGTVPSRGIKKGVVIDVEDTVTAIRESVERARHMAGVPFDQVAVGITGDHVQASNRRGTVSIAGEGSIITATDVARVLEAAAMDVPSDREIIHSLPRFFAVDGHRGVRRPIGMCGQRLEVESHVVTGTASFLQNVVQCVERAGLGVEALVLEPIATSEAVATADERELGVALIDIGGGTSDIAVFMDGSIVHSAVLSVGGNHVTRDISIGLRTPFELAERLKIESGVASPSLIAHGEALEVLTAGSNERQRLPRAILGEIIEARMSELFEMARGAIYSNGHIRLPAGIILTGGGAMLPGAIELAQQVFELPVRLGKPIELSGWGEQVETPQFATAVGLLRFALRQREALLNPAVGSQTTNIISSASYRHADSVARRSWTPAPEANNGTSAASGENGPPATTTESRPTNTPLNDRARVTNLESGPEAGTSSALAGTRTVIVPNATSDAGQGAPMTPFDRLQSDGAGFGNDEDAAREDERELSPLARFFRRLRQLIGFEPS